MLLIPAYGRDYKSAKEAQAAYLAGLDWIVADILSPWDGKYASCRDFPQQEVKLRYGKLRKVTTVTFTGK